MKQRFNPYQVLDCIIVICLGSIIVVVIALLAVSMTRQSALEYEQQERLEFPGQNVDEPSLTLEEDVALAGDPGDASQDIQAIQEDFDDVLTISSWLVGLLSISTAASLAVVLSARWRSRTRRHLTVVAPSSVRCRILRIADLERTGNQ